MQNPMQSSVLNLWHELSAVASVRMINMPQLANPQSRWIFSALLLLACLTLPNASLWALPFAVQVSAESIERDGFRLDQVNVQLLEQGVRLTAGQAALSSQPDFLFGDLQLNCPELGDEAKGWCPAGDWQVLVRSGTAEWQQKLQGQINTAIWTEQNRQLESSLLASAFVAELQYSQSMSAPELRLEWSNQALAKLPFSELLPAQLAWVKAGQSSAVLTLNLGAAGANPAAATSASSASQTPAISLSYELSLKDISLDSPEGRFAAEGLDLQAKGHYRPGSTQKFSLSAKFLSGELLADSFYTAFGPPVLLLDAQLELAGDQLKVKQLKLSDDGAVLLQASASLSLEKPMDTLEYQVQQLQMRFPQAYERYLEPVLASRTLDRLTVTGGFSWAGSGVGSDFPSGTLAFDDLSVVDHARSRFAFTGMSAQVNVGASLGVSDFSWRGMLLGRINLGAGKVDLRTAPGLFELAQPLELAVLGGEFVVDEFRLQIPPTGSEAEPVVNFNASLNAMDMEQLTEALGWPTFAGKISGRIPGASFDQGVLSVDGLLSFDAFDGQIQLSDLRIERPFGVLPSFAADLRIDNLDLQKLTQAFSFGKIAGRLDGYVQDLRMLDWSPVSFDAWVGTPERQSDSRQISRQAVNSLTSIGGGGATAALTGPLMRLFSNFSYRRLGMGCRLENYVCSIRGLEDNDESVLIMEGSGIPKLMIQVFNRRMDFPQLLANLAAASAGEDIRIGDP